MGLLDDWYNAATANAQGLLTDPAAVLQQIGGRLSKNAKGMLASSAASQSVMPSVAQAGNNEMINAATNMGGLLGMTASYGGPHRPMTVEGGAARLDDLTPSFGPDIYGKNAAQYYGTGDAALDRQTLRILNNVKGKPDELIPVFRAVPADAKSSTLSPGDWVTINKDYAKMHGEATLDGNYKIIEQNVPASHLTTNADSFHEQGYYPPK